jgi:hypothetical protein
MNDKSPCFIDTMHKTAPKDEHINAPFHLGKHQTAHRSQAFPLLVTCFLLRSLQLFGTPSERVKIAITRKRVLTRSHIGKCVRKIPPLEYFLVYEVAVVRTYECFRDPTLLKQRFGRPSEVNSFGLDSTGPPPEVVEVTRRPALLEIFRVFRF